MKFISRNHVFNQCPVLARHLIDEQEQIYDPKSQTYEEGQTFGIELDELEILTKENAHILNEEYAAWCMSKRDKFDESPPQIEWVETIIAQLSVTTLEAFTEKLGDSIFTLVEVLGWQDVIVIGATPTPYLEQDNPYAPVVKATEKLRALGMSKTCSDGIIISHETAAEFFSSIFWIARCNASAPHIYFTSQNSNIIGGLCQYGNIHYESYDKGDSRKLRAALNSAKFREVDDRCYEIFEDGIITNLAPSL